MSLSSDGRLALAQCGAALHLVRLEDDRVASVKPAAWVQSSAFGPAGLLATTCSAGTESKIELWRAEPFVLWRTLPGSHNNTRVVFSHDGRVLAEAGRGVRLWELPVPA